MFSASGACSLHPTGRATPMDFKLAQYECDLGVWISGASRLTCRYVRIFKCANHLHVHCTCTMHPSPFLHTAPSKGWVQWLPPFDLQGREKIFGRPLRGGTCHVLRAASRPATGTNVVPAFRHVDRYHPGPDRTSRSGAVPGNAWKHRQTDKHDPANFFSPTHRRKSSFIRTCYAKALAPFILYDFGLDAGTA